MNLAPTMTATPSSSSAPLAVAHDPQVQLRALYNALLDHADRFDEFKQILASYAPPAEHLEEEPADCASVRALLNAKVRSWVGAPFVELSVSQVLQWRAIVVDERLNLSPSPWREATSY